MIEYNTFGSGLNILSISDMISFTTVGIEEETYQGKYYRYISPLDERVHDMIELS